MKPTIAAILLVFLLTGCNEPSFQVGWQLTIPASKSAEAAEFIIKASTPAGPDDGDPEDRLQQATTSARELFGRKAIGVYTNQGTFIPYDDTQGPAREFLDAWLGKHPEKSVEAK